MKFIVRQNIMKNVNIKYLAAAIRRRYVTNNMKERIIIMKVITKTNYKMTTNIVIQKMRHVLNMMCTWIIDIVFLKMTIKMREKIVIN